MSELDNALKLAFEKAVMDKHKTKKANIADALLHKRISNQIKLPVKDNESKKAISNERTRKSNSKHGVE